MAWINAVLGLWILATPFVLSGSITAGAAMWSNVVVGLAVMCLAGWNGYEAQKTAT